MNKDENCIFCKIIVGQIPATKVYEDEHTYAFLTIEPAKEGHTLVIPKDHFENIIGTPDETLCRIMLTTKKVAVAMRNGLDCDGVSIAMVGKDVPHVHVHIIPRSGEENPIDWPTKTYLPDEAAEIAKKIVFALD